MQEIDRRLARIEEEHNVRILLAVESGSRAWGFASPDSDYDVRFVYAHPESHYLSIRVEDRRDVIEQPITDAIDCNGWDLRKALRLLARTNPAIVEWLRSPITYVERGCLRAEALALLPALYSGARELHHYRHMAARNWRGCLRGERVKSKKYFYVLRPLLAVRWIEAFGTPPPMTFDALRAALDLPAALRAAVDDLLARKRSAPELGEGEPIAAIHDWIESELARPVSAAGVPAACAVRDEERWAALDALFVRVLREVG